MGNTQKYIVAAKAAKIHTAVPTSQASQMGTRREKVEINGESFMQEAGSSAHFRVSRHSLLRYRPHSGFHETPDLAAVAFGRATLERRVRINGRLMLDYLLLAARQAERIFTVQGLGDGRGTALQR